MVMEETKTTWTQAKVRFTNLGESHSAVAPLRGCTLTIDPVKKELVIKYEKKNADRRISLSSLRRIPIVAPKQRSISVSVNGRDGAQELLCEFSIMQEMINFFKVLRSLACSDQLVTRTRGLYHNKPNVSGMSTLSSTSYLTSNAKPAKSENGWSRVPQMESSLRGESSSPASSGLYKPLNAMSSSHRSRMRPFDSPSASREPAKVPRLSGLLCEEVENISPALATSGKTPRRQRSSGIVDENLLRHASKPKRTSRCLLQEISMQKDAMNFSEGSSAQRPGYGRRRIQGVDDALLCQSPSKSPVSSQSSVLYSPKREKVPVVRGGFANLGNTCYMNAILQAICGVDEFSKELYRITHRLKNSGIIKDDSTAMMSAISDLASRRLKASHEEKRQLLQAVKAAVKNDAMRFSGYHQEDAQEFLSQVLDQVKEECDEVLKKAVGVAPEVVSCFSNPVTANFSFTLRHQIKCESCGNVVNRSEDANDLPMHLPFGEDVNWNLSSEDFCSVQTLLDDCLKAEKVECRCEKCGSSSSEISHKFEKLPRCIIVYFKRYSYDAAIARGTKREDEVNIPLFLTLCGHCLDETLYYTPPPASVKKISFSQLSLPEEEEYAFLKRKKSIPTKRRLMVDSDFEDAVENESNKQIMVNEVSSSDGKKDVQKLDCASGPIVSFSQENERDSSLSSLPSMEIEECDENNLSAGRSYTFDELNCMSEEDQIQLAMEQSMLEEPRFNSTPNLSVSGSREVSKLGTDLNALLSSELLCDDNLNNDNLVDIEADVNGNMNILPTTAVALVPESPSKKTDKLLGNHGEEGPSENNITYLVDSHLKSRITDGVADTVKVGALDLMSTNEVVGGVDKDGMKNLQSVLENTTANTSLPFSIEIKSDQDGLRTFTYKPVGREWREEACRLLGVTIVALEDDKFRRDSGEIDISVRDAPRRCGTVDGDGNCLFRALAFSITGGNENQHGVVRKKIVEYEKMFSDTFKALKGSSEECWHDYLEEMSNDGQWGSDLEIAACATMLNVEIWTFLKNSWLCYRPRFRVDSYGKRIEIGAKDYRFGEVPGLFLSNQDHHFSPVLEVSNTNFLSERLKQERLLAVIENSEKGEMLPSYRLLSVVSHMGGTNSSGHYVCDVWSRKSNRWFHCDDDSVSELTEDKVRSKRKSTGYIFFYIASELLVGNAEN